MADIVCNQCGAPWHGFTECADDENQARAAHVAKLLEDNYLGEDPPDTLVDLLADIRHFCDANGLNLGEIDRRAHQHYLGELAGRAAAVVTRG